MGDVLANPQRGEFEIEIGGKVRLLRYTFAELAKLDQRLGRSTINVIREQEIGAHFILQALVVGLAATNPKVTQRIVELWVVKDPAKLPYYADILVRALVYAFNGKPLQSAAVTAEQEAADLDADDEADKAALYTDTERDLAAADKKKPTP